MCVPNVDADTNIAVCGSRFKCQRTIFCCGDRQLGSGSNMLLASNVAQLFDIRSGWLTTILEGHSDWMRRRSLVSIYFLATIGKWIAPSKYVRGHVRGRDIKHYS